MAISFYVRYVVVVLYFSSVLISFRKNVFVNRFGRFTLKSGASFAFICFCSVYFLTESLVILNSRFNPGNSIELTFPLIGSSYVVHGGNGEIINHHYPVSAQKYALDIVALNRYGMRSNKLFPKNNPDYCIYQSPVYSPCDGQVVDIVDGIDDNAPGEFNAEHIAGNYIIIKKAGSDISVLLAHLLKGSISVEKGAVVSIGSQLAKIGNSGNSSEPHLHIHCFLGNAQDYLASGKGVPMTFKNHFLYRNCIVVHKHDEI